MKRTPPIIEPIENATLAQIGAHGRFSLESKLEIKKTKNQNV